MEKFSDIIKKERENQGLLLREAAVKLDIDQSLLSRYETGDRRPTRSQVEKLAQIYNLEVDKLIISWLSEKIVYEISNEENASEILKVAEEKLDYLRGNDNVS